MKRRKPKLINEEKTKEKVSAALQDIRNTMDYENLTYYSNSKNNSRCTVTKARIMYDQTNQNTFTPETQTENASNQIHNRSPYHPIPLTGRNVFNDIRQHTTDNFTKNTQRQIADDFHSFNTNYATSMLPQQSINENSFHHVLTHESNVNIMENHMKHNRISKNAPPTIQPNNILSLENEMPLLHNLQPSHGQPVANVANANVTTVLEELNDIQELKNAESIIQNTPTHEIQLTQRNNTREGNETQQVIEVLRDLQREMQ